VGTRAVPREVLTPTTTTAFFRDALADQRQQKRAAHADAHENTDRDVRRLDCQDTDGERPEYDSTQRGRYRSAPPGRRRDRIERERGDEIDAAVDDELATIGDQATADPSDAETETEAAVVSIQNTVVEGLTTDMTYQTFQSDLDESKAELAAAAAEKADAQLAGEMPARIDLTENMSASAQQNFEQARTGVIWMDRLAFVLPVLGIGLVGLLYYVRRSVTKVASDTGWSLLSAGVPTVVGIELARPRLEAMVADAPAEQKQAMEVMVGFTGRVLDTVGDVALVLSVAGFVLLAGSLAIRYGLVERVRESMGEDAVEDTGKL